MAGEHQGLGDRNLYAVEIGPLTNQSTNANGVGVDMQGWDGVAFVINAGVFTGSAVFDARVVEGDFSNMTSMTNVTNLLLTQVASANVNNVFLLDYYNPAHRYVKLCVVPGTNGVQISAISIRYRREGALPVAGVTGGQYVKVAN